MKVAILKKVISQVDRQHISNHTIFLSLLMVFLNKSEFMEVYNEKR